MNDRNARPFRWAILGAGGVARKFVHGLRALGRPAAVHAVASRRIEAARAFAADLGIPHAFDAVAPAVSADVDAVYVATPPSEHEGAALAAIAAGRAVLVEKPFATDGDAAQRIAEAAQAAGVFCMEAMWTRFLPVVVRARALIEAGELGEPRAFDGAFLGADAPDPALSVFDPARGGGALMHRGVYPLSLARHLMGPIAGIEAMGRIGETGVDEDCALILRHASGAVSTLRASLRVQGPGGAMVAGTAGTLELRGPVYRPTAAALTRTVPRRGTGTGPAGGGGRLEGFRESPLGQRISERVVQPLKRLRGGPEVLRAPALGNGYGHEALALMEGVAAGETQSPIMPLAQSVEIMRAVDAAKERFA